MQTRSRSKIIAVLSSLITLLLLSTVHFAQDTKATAPATLPLKDRIWMASKMYESVQMYFAHWKAVPDLGLDAIYKHFIDRIAASDDRREFDFAAMEFIAALKNGHTTYNDPWLDRSDPKPVGFEARKMPDGKFIVNLSANSDIRAGDELQAIDGKPFSQFFKENEKYVTGSSEAARLHGFFYRPYLFPKRFELTVSGRKLTVDRYTQKLTWPAFVDETQGKLLDGGIALLNIPSFGDAKYEQKAVDFIRANASAKAFIIDVRGNGGGSTPAKLIAALMDRPYYDWVEASSANVGSFGAYSQLASLVPPESRDAELKNVIDIGSSLERVEVRFANKRNLPDHPLFKGRVIVLTDSGCASACEDFVMPLKTSGRAEVYGLPTEGSTGQPYLYAFENGINFRVGAKRAYFPDGTEFEGVGITPNVLIEPTPADIRAGKDMVLERAIANALRY
ncbi:MAG: hypothetical protein HS105_00970 [Chloracidobacterium sp.]|nr:hypothetical protein [Chloracidobacterium sp.]